MSIYILFMLAFAGLSYYGVKKSGWLPVILLVCLAVLGPITYLETLSKPKVISQELIFNDKESDILAYLIKPGEALYLLLKINGVSEPRYYVMPWSEKTKKLAEGIQDIFNQKGQKGRMKFPFEKSLETDKRQVYPLPQPMMPMKQPEKQAPNFKI